MSRLPRIEALIKREIADILIKKVQSQIGFVSITGVEISKDLLYAKVFYSQIGTEEEKKKTHWALKTASRFIKGEIGKVIRMKNIPTLHFTYDTSIERGVDLVNKLNHLS